MKKILSFVLALSLFCQPAFSALIVADSYDKLLAKMNGTTTTFVDSSTANPKTITANGNATQLSLPTAFAGKRTALFLNGTTDYGDIADSANFAFGVGAFEIEFYFCTNIAATAQTILDNRNATADTDAWLVNIINSTGNKLCFTTATTARITGTTTLAINTWYKAKLVGNGGANGARTVILYLATADGNYAQEGSTYTADYNFAKEKLRIGSIKAAAGTYMNGWMKNIKLTKATTLVLDMRFDSPATSPLAPAIYFDGTGDYLSLADSADWDVSTGAFTAEGLFRWNAVSSQTLFCMGSNSGGSGKGIALENSGTGFTALLNTSSRATASFTPLVNVWYHIALVRSGTSVYIFANGQQIGSTGSSSDDITGSSEGFKIGTRIALNENFNGSVREFRFSNVARYTTAFTPSQSGFTVDANTKLYIKGNENNGVTTFVDSETSPKTVTTAGDTKIKYTEDYRSCIFKDETGKFPYPVGSAKVDFFTVSGSGVGYFDGTNSTITTDTSTDYKFGTGDLTVEFYARHTTLANYQYYCDIGKDAVAKGIGFQAYNSGSSYIGFNGSAKMNYVVPFTINTWNHIAISRSGTSLKAWVNGTQVATATDSTDIDNSTFTTTFGAQNASGQYFNGLLDNIRISKGVARYTASFNPPDDYEEASQGKHRMFSVF